MRSSPHIQLKTCKGDIKIRSKCKKKIHLDLQTPKILAPQTLTVPSLKVTSSSTWKWAIPKGNSSSIHPFLGAMLVSGRVTNNKNPSKRQNEVFDAKSQTITGNLALCDHLEPLLHGMLGNSTTKKKNTDDLGWHPGKWCDLGRKKVQTMIHYLL